MGKGIGKAIKWMLFLIYLAGLMYFLFFAEMLDRTHMSIDYRYNLIPFKEINRFITYYEVVGVWSFLLNIVGNIIAFMPFGFFLPMVTKKVSKLGPVVASTFAFTLSVELMQLVSRVGSCDVDDLILNTFGGFFGFLCFKIFSIIINKVSKKQT